ncbi:MAG: YdcF family protein [Methylophilales bacterium]|nr:YdcF family protein [Methylophilales bacterium]
MSLLLTNTVSVALLPPLNLLLLSIVGMSLLKTRRHLAHILLGLVIILLWLTSTPIVGQILLRSLEQNRPFNSHQSDVQVIVILGAGRYFNAPEYGSDTLSLQALARTRYAAYLARNTGLPIVTSGGNPDGGVASEASLMKAVLEQEFHVPVRWTEDRSNTSADEARECWKLLAPQGITKIALVTHAWHMPRAKQAFIQAGFEVIPAPMSFTTSSPFSIIHLLPSAEGLSLSRQAMHEWIGLLWYQLRGLV